MKTKQENNSLSFDIPEEEYQVELKHNKKDYCICRRHLNIHGLERR